MTDRELYETALKMTERAYAPFSNFKVGAALLTTDGKVFTGVNVENSSLGGTICAERTAFVKAISEGEYSFEKIAVVANEGEAWPCGICRQFMKEFCDDDFRIITGSDADSLRVFTMAEILPEGFRLSR
ncbi:MAG: cytidine deaminase [Anaerovoracaceae bacterium]